MQRERVIARAAEMFAEYGVKAVRMDDIAHDLAMSKRTLYELFADKRELLYYAILHHMRCESERIAHKIDLEREGIPALFRVLKMMFEKGDVRKRLMTNLERFYPDVYERIATVNRKEGLERLRDMILRLIDNGLVSPIINVDLSVTMFYYTSIGLFTRNSRLVLPEGITEQYAMMYTMINFFRGIATLKGIEQIDKFIEKNKS